MKELTQENKIKLSIIIVLIIFLLFIIILYIRNQNDNNSNEIKSEKKFQIVNDYQLFFFASDNINKFLDELAKGTDNSKYSLLYENYKKEKNIKINNINNTFKNYLEEDNFQPKIIKNYILNKNIIVYLLEGNIVKIGLEDEQVIDENIKFVLFIDYNTNAMSIYPVDRDFNEKQFINNLDKNLSIKNNNYNKYQGGSLIDKNTICVLYLSDYVSNVYKDVEKAYKSTTGFNTLEEYKKYIKEKQFFTNVNNCTLNENEIKKQRTYIIYDSMNNKYIFEEQSIMNYKVSLVN